MPVFSWREWFWVLAWGVFILIVTSVPYLYGAILSTSHLQFSGFVLGLEDGHSYLSKMQQGRSGYWLYHLAYTPEPHQGEPFFLFYILLGKLAALTHWPNAIVFHLSRLVTNSIGLLFFYYFAAYFSEDRKMRLWAYLIFGLTAGVGWLWVILGGSIELGRMPVDLWVPDASFFLSALTFAHLPLAQGLLLMLSVSGLEFMLHGRRRLGFIAAGCGLLVSLIHPHTVPVIGLILGLMILWQYYGQRQQLFVGMIRLALIALPSLPYLLYVWNVFNRNSAFVAWREQSLTYSPAVIHYILGFGITLLLAVVGLVVSWQEAGPRRRFLLVWIIVVPLLVYLPLALQRRFLDGYQAPLAVLAATGLMWFSGRVGSRPWRMILVTLMLVFMTITNGFLVAGALTTIRQRPTPIFIAAGEVEAARWLAEQAGPSVVLASHEVGNYLPTVANVRTFVGHGPETINSETKQAQVETFFNEGTADTWRLTLLRRFNVGYIYFGPRERAIGGFLPGRPSYLRQVFDNGTVQIYQVVADKNH